MKIPTSPCCFPFYVLSGVELFQINSVEHLEREFEAADFGPEGGVEVYDARYRQVGVVAPRLCMRGKLELRLESSQEAALAALWFRHRLIELCLLRPDLGLANENVFCANVDALLAEILTRQRSVSS